MDAHQPAEPAEITRSTRRVAVVVNPVHSASRRALEALRECCERFDLDAPDVRETTADSPGYEQAREALEEGADVVVVIGGDGTVREVAQALADTGVPMGIVPTGTANLYARNAGLFGHDLQRTVRLAIIGAPEAADLGQLELTTEHGTQQRTFLVVVGMGHDADTVADVEDRHKATHGWLSYFLPGVRRLGNPLIPLRIDLEGREPETRDVWSVLVANTGMIPGGIHVVPDARPNDGELHLAIVAPTKLTQWARIAAAGIRPRYRAPSGLEYRRGEHVTVESDSPRRVQVDGDVVEGVTRLDARIRPGALTVHAIPSRQSIPGSTTCPMRPSPGSSSRPTSTGSPATAARPSCGCSPA